MCSGILTLTRPGKERDYLEGSLEINRRGNRRENGYVEYVTVNNVALSQVIKPIYIFIYDFIKGGFSSFPFIPLDAFFLSFFNLIQLGNA